MTGNSIAPTDVPEVTQDKIDDLEHKIEDAEAAYAREHPKTEHWAVVTGADEDEPDDDPAGAAIVGG